jgi:hypothetical protein
MLPEARICHRIAGRIRIQIPSQRGNQAYFAQLQEQLAQCPGVHQVEVNPITASALLLHEVSSTALVEYAAARELFVLDIPPDKATPVYEHLLQPFYDLNKGLAAFTKGELDLPGILFMGLIGLGIYQISKGNFTAPAWYTAFWYAINIVLKAQSSGSKGE